ncbi:hypothetical protein HDU67_001129 [Dinochytrium kinnereticum]|nr:hypothetical protein HDU67_001129 [Dinochytrium kinnereticum]
MRSLLTTTKRFASTDVVTRSVNKDVFVKKGGGGRSSVSGHVATVFGCTGFLGRYVVNNLGKKGTQVITPYRGSDDEKRHLKPMGDLGQIVQLRFDLRNDEQMAACIRHSDTVINLIGTSHSTKNFKMSDVNVGAARKIAQMSKELGVSKLIHVSTLGADVNSPSSYHRTKAEGEMAVKEEFPTATIVRPSTLFGHEDKFLNMMGYYAKFSPFGFPLFNNGKTVVRPVYVNDVAVAISQLVRYVGSEGKTYELYGPRAYHYESLARFFLDVSKRDPTVWYCPKAAARVLGWGVNLLSFHTPNHSVEIIDKMYIDEVPTGESTFADLGMEPLVLEDSVLRFLKKYRPAEFQIASFEPDVKKYLKDGISLKET